MACSSLTTYLREIGRHPLLTAAEEVTLGHSVRQWQDWEGGPEAAPRVVQRKGRRAMERMVQANLRLVVNVAKKYSSRAGSLDLLDLIQEGSVGLMRGVEKFDPARGYKFSTYAYWWIRQGVTRAIDVSSRTLKLPITLQLLVTKAHWIQSRHLATTGVALSRASLAEELGVSLEKLREVEEAAVISTSVSLDNPLKSGEGTLADLLADPNSEIEADWDSTLALDALKHLSEDQQDLLKRNLIKEESLQAIGKEIGATRDTMRRRKDRALRRLRRQLDRDAVAA